ncbi:MAG: LysE family transporter [Deltaproteobacteria bacterium]|nr:LysE family transporter [Deltaproteobacteria bacterium]
MILNEITGAFSTFWVIFSFSFLVALTGAMSPGPLLTYTIVKSVKASKRGYLMGLWIIVGHAILEMGIVLLLLLGFSFVLKNIIVVRTIGVVGGLILVYLGSTIVRDVYLGNIPTDFLQQPDAAATHAQPAETASDTGVEDTDPFKYGGLENPIVGGIVVSMSNPYWWVWWATIGFAFMIQFDISIKQWPRLIAFFLGHETGDLVWYLLVSTLAYFGMRCLNRKIYYGILALCGIFLILFGIYLGISPFIPRS